MATVTTSSSLLAAPASCPGASALYVVNLMKGLDSWGSNSAKYWFGFRFGFFLFGSWLVFGLFPEKREVIFWPDHPSEQVCFKAVLAELK